MVATSDDETHIQKIMAQQIVRYINRVRDPEVDRLGAFFISHEWPIYLDYVNDIYRDLEDAGYVVAPVRLTRQMVRNAEPDGFDNRAMSISAMQGYLTGVWTAFIVAWEETGTQQSIEDVFSMILSRASDPGLKTEEQWFTDSSFRRYTQDSRGILETLLDEGVVVLPDALTPYMLSAGVAATANSDHGRIGADPKYLQALYGNLLRYRPIGGEATAEKTRKSPVRNLGRRKT